MPRMRQSSATNSSASNTIRKWPSAISTRADDRGAALAEHAIGEPAAEDRREIREAGVEAEDLRGERLRLELAEHALERALDRP